MQKQELFIPGPLGNLEAVIQLPNNPIERVGVICHPNPLQEGTMQNKVVTTVARTFNAMGVAAVRFNYRGVGQSSGTYGNITGEVDDGLAIVRWVKAQWPQANLWLAGFSFGAYIAAALAAQEPTEHLISIAPAVDRMPYKQLPHIACPWLVIQGEEDDVVIPASVYAWFDQLDANKTLIKMPETGHFFHGKLIELQQVITNNIHVID
jgi:alpha/beta superfamily hydrolase